MWNTRSEVAFFIKRLICIRYCMQFGMQFVFPENYNKKAHITGSRVHMCMKFMANDMEKNQIAHFTLKKSLLSLSSS